MEFVVDIADPSREKASPIAVQHEKRILFSVESYRK